MSFHVGQRVVCVDATARDCRAWTPDEALEKGIVYTIARVFSHPCGEIDEFVELVERRRSEFCKEYWGHRGYSIYRFRPLDERRLDIFREMLVSPPKVLERVRGGAE